MINHHTVILPDRSVAKRTSKHSLYRHCVIYQRRAAPDVWWVGGWCETSRHADGLAGVLSDNPHNHRIEILDVTVVEE